MLVHVVHAIKMIIKTLYSGLFLPQKLLNEVATKSRLRRKHKASWFFLGLNESMEMVEPFIRIKGRYVMKQLEIMGLGEQIKRLVDELERVKRPVAVKVIEGVYVHPEALGKVLIKIGKRLNLDDD